MAYLGESIPKLGFGLMRLPKLEDGSDDIEQVMRMVDLFMDAGLSYFDTARAYGASEAVTKRALVDRYPRESFQLATKNAAWLGAKSEEEAKAMFDTSLETTGAGYFDYYLIHNIGNKRTKYFDDWSMWEFVKQKKALSTETQRDNALTISGPEAMRRHRIASNAPNAKMPARSTSRSWSSWRKHLACSIRHPWTTSVIMRKDGNPILSHS